MFTPELADRSILELIEKLKLLIIISQESALNKEAYYKLSKPLKI